MSFAIAAELPKRNFIGATQKEVGTLPKNGKVRPMTNTYRASWAALVGRYEWPAPEDPRFAVLEAQG